MEVVSLKSGRFLTELEWLKREEAYLVYRSANMKLGALAIAKQRPRWRQRPKSHSLEHAVYDFNFCNLRYVSNYLDEDFVRRSKKLAIKSDAKHVSRHVLFRYSVAACLRWSKMDLK